MALRTVSGLEGSSTKFGSLCASSYEECEPRSMIGFFY